MRIAIFDYQVTRVNPSGSCNRKIVETLSNEHEFTVFSVQFDNPAPERVQWVRVRVPLRPLALLFLAYHLAAPFYYFVHRLRKRAHFDVVQKVESNLLIGQIAYAHFCHSAFLRDKWREIAQRDMRSWFRWLDHRLHAILEKTVYARAHEVVVPSLGIERELLTEFDLAGKTSVIYNPVDVTSFRRPEQFDGRGFRTEIDLQQDDTVLVFIALGHFERKGLPLILDAFERLNMANTKLLVVGGTEDLVNRYTTETRRRNLEDRIHFIGAVDDVRPYLWVADAFIMPSAYEGFPLVCLQAAAAGIPLITTDLYGVEELLEKGPSGIIVDRTTVGIAAGIQQFMAMDPDRRKTMGRIAQEAVTSFDEAQFTASWRAFYARFQTDLERSQTVGSKP